MVPILGRAGSGSFTHQEVMAPLPITVVTKEKEVAPVPITLVTWQLLASLQEKQHTIAGISPIKNKSQRKHDQIGTLLSAASLPHYFHDSVFNFALL